MNLYKILATLLVIAFATGASNGMGTFKMCKKPIEKVYTTELYSEYLKEYKELYK